MRGLLIRIRLGLILGLLSGSAAYANPQGADVVRGQVNIAYPNASTLNIRNTPGAIINWQQFSIQQNETTRFIQHSASSAILNRVTSQNPSSILGQLLSNGRVFVINPNGIVFGGDSVVDTAGLIASTLDMRDEDFIDGNLRFQGSNAADIQNRGYIKAGADGEIFLIAPNIENSGIIETEGGQIMLAAGESLSIASLDSDHIVFDVQAPEDAVVNLGEIITRGGAAGMFAGTIKHSGSINADSIGNDASGNIVLSASRSITQGNGSTLTASGGTSVAGGGIRLIAQADPGNGPAVIYQHGKIDVSGTTGGTIGLAADNILQAGDMYADGDQDGGSIDVRATGQILALENSVASANSRISTGGQINITADTSLFTSSSYSAAGTTGGQVQLLGAEVKVAGASVDASGTEGGGSIYVGGGYQGKDENIRNAERTVVNSSASFMADAIQTGDGGTIIVWADVETYFTGRISATGGENAGNGGFVEVSGKEVLEYGGTVDLVAPVGELGTLLLDPRTITVSGSGSATVSSSDLLNPNPGSFNQFGQDPAFGSKAVVELANGNLVVVDINSDFGASNAGAVYIFDPSGGMLIGTILGTSASDRVGSGGVTLLANGNFVIGSPGMDILGVNGGAVTLHDGATGEFINGGGGYGPVTSLNSLYGTNSGDSVSGSGVAALSNGNYVVLSRRWNSLRGAVTLGNGVSGITGAVSNTNSITSFTTNNAVGIGGSDDIVELSNGNFVLKMSSFRRGTGTSNNLGAVTLLNGITGEFVNGSACTPPNCGYGFIDFPNSLIGTAADNIGGGVVALGNGNYVVISNQWDGDGSFFGNKSFGAVSLMDGTTGQFVNGGGVSGINSSNSLVGTNTNDRVGFGGVTELANGDYVVSSWLWNNNTGAVSQMDGATGQFVNGGGGVTGISSANSIVGNSSGFSGARTGLGFALLSNGNYVIGSPNAAAATLVDGTSGQFVNGGGVGVIDSINSIIINTSIGITPLSNGNYVLNDPGNNVGGLLGTAILVNGITGLEIGRINGFDNRIEFGDGGIFELSNGNYVVLSMDAGDNGSTGDLMGTVLASGVTGMEIGRALDLDAGSTGTSNSVVVLSNGNYVELAPEESTNLLSRNGIARLLDGNTGLEIARISGDDSNDGIGSCSASACVSDLGSGQFVLSSSETVGGMSNAGSIIVVDSTTGAEVDRLTGASAFDQIGSKGIIKLASGKLVVLSPNFDGSTTDEGRITIVNIGPTPASDLSFSNTPSTDSILSAASIKAALEGGNLVLQSNSDFILAAGNDILVSNTGAGGNLTIKAGRSVVLNANIVTDNGNLTIIGNETLANGVVTANRDPGAAVITMATGVMIDAGTGNVVLDLRDGAGRSGSQASTGMVTLADIYANTLTLAGGVVDGVGIIMANVDNTGATLAPGASPGTLTINGNYSQGANATLEIELGGLAQGVSYDLLSISGTATLDGTLDLVLFGGFAETAGDKFNIIASADIISDFASINNPFSESFSAVADTPATGIYQIEILSTPATTPSPPVMLPADNPPIVAPVMSPADNPPIVAPDDEVIDVANDQLIVLSDYQNEVAAGIVDEDDEEKSDLVCR